MQWDHVSRIDFLERLDRFSNVVLWMRREMKAPDHRMNFLHAEGGLNLLDRIDHAAMAARRQNDPKRSDVPPTSTKMPA